MATKLNPYLNFKDNARQALEFYHHVFGGQLQVSTFGEAQMSQDPSEVNKIMHGQIDVPDGMTLMVSDMPPGMPFQESANGNICISGEDEAELRGYWEKLSDGAKIIEPLVKAPWGDTFGMLTDKFGVTWLVNINGQHA
jgi:PhnB protein